MLDLSRVSLETRLTQQWQSRQNVRALSLNLLGAQAVTVTLFVTLASGFGKGTRVVDLVFAASQTLLFALAVVCAVAILWSKSVWIYGTSGSKIFAWSTTDSETDDDIRHKIITELASGQVANEKLLLRHAFHFRLQLTAFAVATSIGPLFAIAR